jgi:fimbrial chaperone protein
MSTEGRRGAVLLTVLPLFFLAAIAQGASIGIAPVRVNFEPADRSQVVTLTNGGTEPVSMQADPRLWVQDEEGGDVYSETSDLLVVPRIFTIAPGASQIVRIGRLTLSNIPREQAYRVFFTELAPGEESGSQLQFRLRLAIPVFMAPAGRSEPRLELLQARHTEEGFEVVLGNTGNTHVQVLELSGNPVADYPAEEPPRIAGGYMLPGTSRRFLLPIPQHIVVTSVKAETDVAGNLEYGLSPPD